jgi:hypothetical protein
MKTLKTFNEKLDDDFYKDTIKPRFDETKPQWVYSMKTGSKSEKVEDIVYNTVKESKILSDILKNINENGFSFDISDYDMIEHSISYHIYNMLIQQQEEEKNNN